MQEQTTNDVSSCDYVTVVTMDKPTGKLYEIINGELVKTPAANNANGWANTHYAPHPDALAGIIKGIGDKPNCALILGYVRGTEDGVAYRLMSDRDFRNFAEISNVKLDKFASAPVVVDDIKYATRTKRMFHPSTWFGFDRDIVDGMPDELEPHATFDRWLELMGVMLPEIGGASYVAVSSASCRVLRNGVPVSATNGHVYMQAHIAADTERFGKAGMVTSFARGFGFMRPIKDRLSGEVIGNRPWTLYDPTTFSRERLFFDGSPLLGANDPAALSGELSIAPSDAKVYLGEVGRVNTVALKMPSAAEQRERGMEINVDAKGRVTVINPTNLTPDVAFEYHNPATGEEGVMTMREFVDGPVDRLRCQAVFRPDSSSFAAYVSKEDDCHPFLFDVGTGINYKYSNSVDAFAEAALRVANNSVHGATLEAALIPKPPVVIGEGDFPTTHPQYTIGDLPNDVASPSFPAPSQEGLYSASYGALFQGDVAREYVESDLGNAQRFAFMFDGELKFVPTLKSWFVWQVSKWAKCESSQQRHAAQQMAVGMALEGSQLPDDHTFRKWARTSLSSNAIGSTLREAAVVPSMVIGIDDIDTDWFNFGVANGRIDLRLNRMKPTKGILDEKGEFGDQRGLDNANGCSSCRGDRNGNRVDNANGCRSCRSDHLVGYCEPDRSLFITKTSEVEYVEAALCPEWESTIYEIFSCDQEIVDFFQKFVGYSMCGNPVHEVMAFLVGGGSNGKSTVTGVIGRIFGTYKVTVDKNVLMAKREANGQAATPALARLKGVRLAVVTETKESDVIDESVVKALSGSDTITARHLQGENFDFDATFVSWIATNHPPAIMSSDEGTWRRIWHFPFKRNFRKEIGLAKLDTGIKDRIIDKELSGVLNWCLEGVRRYHVEGLVPPNKITQSTDQYREDMDIIADWMSECTEVGEEYECTHAQVWQSYSNYSIARGDALIKKSRTLTAKIAAKGFVKIRHVTGSHSARGFKGLRIISPGV